MTKLFFIFTGGYSTLPMAELRSILEVGGYERKELIILPQVAVIESELDCISLIVSRSSMIKSCGICLFFCKAILDEIIEEMKKLDIEGLISPHETFAVRVKKIQGSSPELRSNILEAKIGSLLIDKDPRLKVDLEHPDKTFLCILSGGWFIFGLRLAELTAKDFEDRAVRRRPASHPSSLMPRLARCFVNLSRAKPGDVLLDPFCGVGGILIEGGMIGCKVLGIDVQEDMVKGSILNLHYYGIDPLGLIVADSRALPLTKVDVIVTDLPYGRASTTLKLDIRQITEKFFSDAYRILPKGAYSCIVSMENSGVADIAAKFGFKVVERHLLPIHKGLAREIIVIRRD